MRARALQNVFHRILLCSSAATLAASAAACGGRLAEDVSSDASPDGATDSAVSGDVGVDTATIEDTATRVDASGTCATSTRPDPIPPCGYAVKLYSDPAACGIPGDAGVIPEAVCQRLCDSTTIHYCYLLGGSTASIECGGPCEGRRPAGLARARLAAGDARQEAIGRWFARSAYLEAASVDAFRILRAELHHHGAPSRLLRACSRAARDEVRHARAATALARRYRVRAPKPAVPARAVRSLEAIATDNAIEGCVRETFGAMIATVQAHEARDPVVRAAMMRIARDETQHAALSWTLDAWMRARLSPLERERVETARARAIAELRTETAAAIHGEAARVVGVPSKERAAAMLDAMGAQLW